MASRVTESQILSHTATEVEQRFTNVDDLAHGWEHISRVYKLAQYIATQEGADEFIVGMAALMHDLGRAVSETNNGQPKHHAEHSVILATELMHSYQLPEHTQEAILHAIIAHSFSRGIQPQTLEAQVIRDADRLDGLGAIGIMRWAMTGVIKRTSQTRSYHPDDAFAQQHTPDDHLYILDHFFTKLLKLEETMTTKTGKRLAHRRSTFMQTYLDEFRRELDLL